MAENALKQRTTADNVLKEAIRDLTRLKGTANPSIRLLKNKLKKLNEAKDELLAIHYMYAEKSGKALDSEEMSDWITPKLDEAIDLADEVFVTIDEYEENQLKAQETVETGRVEAASEARAKNELLITEKQSETTENLIRSRVTEMSAIVDDENRNSENDKSVVRGYLREIEGLMESQTKSWSEVKKGHVSNVVKLTEIFAKEEDLSSFVSSKRL